METEDIALFDMDGTLCDYEHGLAQSLEIIQSPTDSPIKLPLTADAPKYVWQRVQLITESPEWWAELAPLQLGFDLWKLSEQLHYRQMILTQGPKRNAHAWSGKKMWIDKHLGQNVDITITRDKGLVYGKVLVDDYPPYIERWLAWRPRGLVIMPANDGNSHFAHKQVIRYDGSNLAEVHHAMSEARQRGRQI